MTNILFMDDEKVYQLGILVGTSWAFNSAMPRQLEMIVDAYGPKNEWSLDSDEIIQAILNECPYDSEFVDLGGVGVDEFNESSDFVEGFAEGCMHVWKVYKPKMP